MGPCFPRDNRALIYTAKKFGITLPIAEATDRINKHQVPRLVEKILSLLPQNGKVSILGLSYKPDTNVIEESQGLELAKILSERGVSVTAYDPAAMENAKKVLSNEVIFANSLRESLQKANLIVIAIPWPEFKNIEPDWLKPGTILIDCWRILAPKKYEATNYFGLGIYAPKK